MQSIKSALVILLMTATLSAADEDDLGHDENLVIDNMHGFGHEEGQHATDVGQIGAAGVVSTRALALAMHSDQSTEHHNHAHDHLRGHAAQLSMEHDDASNDGTSKALSSNIVDHHAAADHHGPDLAPHTSDHVGAHGHWMGLHM